MRNFIPFKDIKNGPTHKLFHPTENLEETQRYALLELSGQQKSKLYQKRRAKRRFNSFGYSVIQT